MTQVRIDGDAIAALGRRLAEHAIALRDIESIPDLGSGFLATAGPACRDAVTDWSLRRLALCDELDSLARLAKDAGAVYVDTEVAVDSSLRGRRG